MPNTKAFASAGYLTARRLRFVPGPTATSPRDASVPAGAAVKVVPNEWGSAALLYSLDREDDYQFENAVDGVDFVPAQAYTPLL